MSTIKSSKLRAEILEPTIQINNYTTILSGYMDIDANILDKAQAILIVEKMQEQLDTIKKFILNA